MTNWTTTICWGTKDNSRHVVVKQHRDWEHIVCFTTTTNMGWLVCLVLLHCVVSWLDKCCGIAAIIFLWMCAIQFANKLVSPYYSVILAIGDIDMLPMVTADNVTFSDVNTKTLMRLTAVTKHSIDPMVIAFADKRHVFNFFLFLIAC